jgi:hypothetical protein
MARSSFFSKSKSTNIPIGSILSEIGLHDLRPDPYTFHKNWRDLNFDRIQDKQIFFEGDKVYGINVTRDGLNKDRIGTIKSRTRGSLFGEPFYEVDFEDVSDGGNKRITNVNQSDLFLQLPEDIVRRGGKNRKISKKYRKSKYRKSKYRKSKNRK